MGIIDILLLAVVGVVTWCVASEGAWGAGMIFVCTLLAGLLAMNFFEPLANFLEGRISQSWSCRWDIIALLGLFAGLTLLLRTATEYFAPKFMAVDNRVYDVLRWAFAGATGYTTMAILLTALHTAPLPREFAGFKAERRNFFEMAAPDRQWLGFTQYVSERAWPRGSGRVFDGPSGRIGTYEGIWPSFPIRYATRRQQYSTGTASVESGGTPGLRRRSSRSRRNDPSEGGSF